MRKTAILLLLLSLLISCRKIETDYPSSFKSPIIHGYLQTNELGIIEKQVGIDDTKTTDPKLGDLFRFLVYPNPCSEVVHLYFGNNSNILKKIWVVPAGVSINSISSMSANFRIVQGRSIISFETNNNQVQLDLTEFDYKYYRVNVKINDVLLWNNIVKQSK